jgi:hypothetical protein
VDALDTEYVRADVHDRVLLLLREALEELRAGAQAAILSEARLARAAGRSGGRTTSGWRSVDRRSA